MCSVDAVPAFAVTTPVGSRRPCGLLCSFLTPRFAMLCMYIAVAVMMACHLSLIHTLVYMSKGGYCDCMTVKHGMTAYESYRGIHAGVTESAVKIGGSAACRHDNRNNNKNIKAFPKWLAMSMQELSIKFEQSFLFSGLVFLYMSAVLYC